MPAAASRKRPKKTAVAVGDYVLCGGTRASYPGEWCLGSVLWVGTRDALLERSTLNGQTWRQTVVIPEIRAIGTIEELGKIKEQARKACAELTREIRKAESALGRARDNLFAKLDELAEGGLKIIPLDFEAIEAAHRRDQGAVEQADIEAEGGAAP
jgi:hypothetical protein